MKQHREQQGRHTNQPARGAVVAPVGAQQTVEVLGLVESAQGRDLVSGHCGEQCGIRGVVVLNRELGREAASIDRFGSESRTR